MLIKTAQSFISERSKMFYLISPAYTAHAVCSSRGRTLFSLYISAKAPSRRERAGKRIKLLSARVLDKGACRGATTGASTLTIHSDTIGPAPHSITPHSFWGLRPLTQICTAPPRKLTTANRQAPAYHYATAQPHYYTVM